MSSFIVPQADAEGHPTTGDHIDTIIGQLDGVQSPRDTMEGTSWMACCPVHDDSNPSLSITQKADGTVLVHCFAGCAQSDVCDALGLSSRPRNEWMPGGIQHKQTYDYLDEDGDLVFQVLRGLKDGDKTFRQRVPDASQPSGFAWSLKGLPAQERSLLYNGPGVAGAIAVGETVLLVEGEQDVETARAGGYTATCNAGGVGKFSKAHAEQLRGADVLIVQDKDTAGRKHGSQAYRLLDGVAQQVRLYDVHGSLPEKADLTDHLNGGFGLDDLIEADPEPAPVTELETGGDPLPPIEPLTSLLAEPDEPVTYRISGLLPTGSRAVLAAQFKAGKTTLSGNLARCLADGAPFLGRFAVNPLPDGETVVVLDYEMNRNQNRIWFRDQGIHRTEAVYVAILRGQIATFNILDPLTRAAWVEKLRAVGAAIVIFDCLRPVLDALGLDEHHDAGRFLVAFDRLLVEAGVSEAILVHHMGHNGERSRGDSRIRDWPDAEWRIVREKPKGLMGDDPAAPRFFSAYGRDVEVPESALAFDPATRHLTIAGGSRSDSSARQVLEEVIDVLADAGSPLSQNSVWATLNGTGPTKQSVLDALQQGVVEGSILLEDGARNSKLFSLPAGPTTQMQPSTGLTDPDQSSTVNPTTDPTDPDLAGSVPTDWSRPFRGWTSQDGASRALTDPDQSVPSWRAALGDDDTTEPISFDSGTGILDDEEEL